MIYAKLIAGGLVLAGLVYGVIHLVNMGAELGTLRVTNQTLKAELANRIDCLAKINAYQADLARYKLDLAAEKSKSAAWLDHYQSALKLLDKLRNEPIPAAPVILPGTPCDEAVRLVRQWEATNVH